MARNVNYNVRKERILKTRYDDKIKNVLARAISLASEQPMSYNEVGSLLEDIDTRKVKIWLEEGAISPKYAHKEDARMDLSRM